MAKQNNGGDIVRREFNFKLMAVRILLFNIAYNCRMLDDKLSSRLYEKLWKVTKNDTPDLSIREFIGHEIILSKIGLGEQSFSRGKEDFEFHKNIISNWATRGIMNI